MTDVLVTAGLVVLIGVALFHTFRDIYWMFRPQNSPGMRGLRNGWDEGYAQGLRDGSFDQEPADNPYRRDRNR